MKTFKIIGIALIIIIVSYILLITIEVIRFNNNFYLKPLITVGSTNVNVKANSNVQKEEISGIGYTFEYEYIIHREEHSDNQANEVISGKLKLFNKFILSTWIE